MIRSYIMPLVNGGKCSDSGHNSEGDDRQKCHGDCDEEQESRCLVRECVREAATPVHHEGKYLIHDFNRDVYPSPQP